MNAPGPALQLDHAATVYSTDFPPVLAGSGTFVTVAVRNPLLADPHPAAVQRYLERTPYDLDLFGSTRGR